MNLGSICKRHVVTIDAKAPLQEAARRMRDQHVGALVITRDTPEGRRVDGLLTDRDLAVEVLAGDTPGARLQQVGQFTERTLVTATESTGLPQAIDLMRAAGVRRLLVRDEQGRLAGIVAFDDLLQACAEQLSGLADVVRPVRTLARLGCAAVVLTNAAGSLRREVAPGRLMMISDQQLEDKIMEIVGRCFQQQ